MLFHLNIYWSFPTVQTKHDIPFQPIKQRKKINHFYKVNQCIDFLILQNKKVGTCYKIIIKPINVNSAKNELQVYRGRGRTDGCVGGWLNRTGRLGTAVPGTTQNFPSRTTHDVDLASVAREGKYFTGKQSLCAADACTGQFWRSIQLWTRAA